MNYDKKTKYLFSQFFYILVIQAVFTTAAVFFEHKGMNLSDALLLMARLGAAINISIACIGLLKNRGHRSQQGNLYLGFLSLSVGILIFALSQSVELICLGATLIAIGSAMTKPVITILYGRYVAGLDGNRSYKSIYAVTNFGAMIGPFIFGLVAVASYSFFFLVLAALSLLIAIFHSRFSHSYMFFKRHWLYLGGAFLSLYAYIAGFVLFGLTSLLIISGLKFLNQKTFDALKKLELEPLLHVFLFFLMMNQKYFMIQELFIVKLAQPFNPPLLYALSGFVVVVGILIQLYFKLGKPSLTTHILSYSLCALAYAGISLCEVGNISLLYSIVAFIVLFSIAEILYIPYALERVSKHSHDKLISTSVFFLTIGLSRLVASYVNEMLEVQMICIGSIALCAVAIITRSVRLKTK